PVDNDAPAEDIPQLARYLATIYFAALRSACRVYPQLCPGSLFLPCIPQTATTVQNSRHAIVVALRLAWPARGDEDHWGLTPPRALVRAPQPARSLQDAR